MIETSPMMCRFSWQRTQKLASSRMFRMTVVSFPLITGDTQDRNPITDREQDAFQPFALRTGRGEREILHVIKLCLCLFQLAPIDPSKGQTCSSSRERGSYSLISKSGGGDSQF
jgi:hypothetical protein